VKKAIAGLLGVVGVLMMLSVAVINSYVAFFVHGDYTGGMFAASVFWVLVGWIFFYSAMNEE